jgi:orotate phosphoribosyltransferase
MNPLEYLRDEIDHKGIFRVPPNRSDMLAKAPNQTYRWQFYLRRCLFDPRFTLTAAEILVAKLPDKDIQIAACETAGVPLGLAMAAVLGTPMLSVKKERKVYGLMNFTEGVVTGKPIVVVDDLAGSQGTLKIAVNTLHAFGLPTADHYVTLVDKTKYGHAQNYVGSKHLISLFTCEDFALSWEDYVLKYNREPNFGKFY